MVSHIHNNLNANEDFVLSLTSRFITCFIDIHLYPSGFNSGMKFLSIAYYQGKVNIYIYIYIIFWVFEV